MIYQNFIGRCVMIKSVWLTVITLVMMPMSFADDLNLDQLKQMLKISEALSESEAAKENEASSSLAMPSVANIPASRRVLLDVRSNHSDGKHDMDYLINLAKKRGIDTLVFGEHDRYSIRLGIDPIPQWLGYEKQHPSLYVTGLEEFFADLQRVRNNNPDMHIMAATESTPGYYWSGFPFSDLTLHDAEEHLIALGIETPDQVKALPSYDLRNIRGNFELSMAFWIAISFILLIILMQKRKRAVALLLFASLVAFLATWMPRNAMDPAIDFIDTAREQGLFVIWTHPGTLSGVRPGPMGVQLNTPPYNERVFEKPTADAFVAVYGDTDANTIPGGMWDRFMMDYMLGYRLKPIWAVAAGDYHGEGDYGVYLGDFPMDVWADGKDNVSVMKAIRAGRMASWGMGKDQNIRMRVLMLQDETGKRMLPGDDRGVTGKVKLYAAIEEASERLTIKGLRAEWIVNGRVVARPVLSFDKGALSVESLDLEAGVHVVRLRIPAQHGIRMEANPFLLRVND